ncbi:MAG: RsmD family RNA methyltransferase [Planctomycetia bacterium]|nr:RsmD family RNA methyltransferase [Planctomycetia bacterium]
MSEKNRTNPPQDRKFRFSPDEYRKNQENYRKNLQGHSNDTMGQPDDEPEEGKLSWSDVYVVGRKSRTDLAGGQRRPGSAGQRVREAEDALKTPRILSSKEFIEHYNAARTALGPLPPLRVPKEETPAASSNSRSRDKRGHNVGSEPGDRGKSVGLRVIGGRYRGTKLHYGGDNRVRPMKDRVREAIFNLIGTEVKEKVAIDLFAGTGALAFEALSRGAVAATLIEVHFPTARVIRDNIALLREKDVTIPERIDLKTTDVFFWGKNLPATSARGDGPRTDLPWIVFCSPPYDFYLNRTEEMLELLRSVKEVAPAGSLFIIEADDRFDFDLLQEDIPRRKRRSYPPAEVAIYYK